MPVWEDIKKRTEEKRAENSESQDIVSPYYRAQDGVSKLEIRLKSGGTIAIDYSLMPVLFSPSNDTIVIPTMLNLKITISGSNLILLKNNLTDNRVKWVKEHNGTKPPLNPDELFVESIKIEAMAFEEAVGKMVD